jgi:hypothetical protein
MTTTTEQERAAYISGDTDKAALLARIDALQRALGEATARIDELEADLSAINREYVYGGTE